MLYDFFLFNAVLRCLYLKSFICLFFIYQKFYFQFLTDEFSIFLLMPILFSSYTCSSF